MYCWVGVCVPISRMLEKVVVAAFLTYCVRNEVDEAGSTAAYSRSNKKVSKTSRTMSMAALRYFRGCFPVSIEFR